MTFRNRNTRRLSLVYTTVVGLFLAQQSCSEPQAAEYNPAADSATQPEGMGAPPSPGATLVSLSLTPGTATLSTGSAIQFRIAGDWSDGNTTPPNVNYTATGGKISTKGLYTAGSTVGTFRLIARQTGGTLADTSVVIVKPRLLSMSLTPGSTSLLAAGTRQFTVTGSFSDGTTGPTAVTYSATGGTISSGGLYTAGSTNGTFRVIAVHVGGVMADSSVVTITAPLPVLQKVILTPASTSLTAGASWQFGVSGQWSDGSTTAPAVTYTATGGTITAGGMYTAGNTAGNFSVIAVQQGGALADTSAVAISGASSTPLDTVWAEGFESGANPWGDEGQEQNHAIVAPPGGAHSGTRAQQVTYPAGADGGWLTRFFMPGYDSIYVRYYIKLESTWLGGTKLSSLYGSRTDNQWSAAGKSGVCPNGTDFFQVTLTGDPTPQMWLRFYDQYYGMPSSGGSCYGSNGSAGTTMTPSQFQLATGVWHKVEYWMKLNDPALTNSYQEFKIDDVVRGAWSGISVRTSTILKLNAFTLTMSAPSGAPHTQHLWVDDILIARQRPAQ